LLLDDAVHKPDCYIAVIADVHSATFQCLEEGVGHANEIYVVAPIEGKLYLTRGATFSYYEFTQPVGDRLTDEAWQGMLKTGKAAAPPAWTASFLTKPKAEIPPRLKRRQRRMTLTRCSGPRCCRF
jgi:hypothetical protein